MINSSQIKIFLNLLFLWTTLSIAHGEMSSTQWPIIIENTNAVLSKSLLQQGEKTTKIFFETLGLEPQRSVTYHFKWIEEHFFSPSTSQFHWKQEGKQCYIECHGPRSQLSHDVTRAFILALLQGNTFENLKGKERPMPPFWLTEGLTLKVEATRKDLWESVIEKNMNQGQTPTLHEITSWKKQDISSREQIWRQAFSYWLVKSIADTELGQSSLRIWLERVGKGSSASYQPPIDNEEAWWQEMMKKSELRDVPMFPWRQTRVALQQACELKEGLKKPINLLDMPADTLSLNEDKIAMLKAKLLKTELEAHFLWRPIIGQFARALSLWENHSYNDHRDKMVKAVKNESQAAAWMEKVSQRLDWYEINRCPASHTEIDWSSLNKAYSATPPLKQSDPLRERLIQLVGPASFL